jgi:hypothetical protein
VTNLPKDSILVVCNKRTADHLIRKYKPKCEILPLSHVDKLAGTDKPIAYDSDVVAYLAAQHITNKKIIRRQIDELANRHSEVSALRSKLGRYAVNNLFNSEKINKYKEIIEKLPKRFKKKFYKTID